MHYYLNNKNLMVETGCVIGRFQPPHIDHLEYILKAGELCQHLIIGITQPDINKLNDHNGSHHRSTHTSNPLTYDERHTAIEIILKNHHTEIDSYEIIEFPIDKTSQIQNSLPTNTVFFTTIIDDWNIEKIRILEDLGFDVCVLWERREQKKKVSGTRIRSLLVDGNDQVKHLLPKGIFEYLQTINIQARLKKMDY